jgi:ATP-dependent exoDNAse (exonuclease V) beta subunit
MLDEIKELYRKLSVLNRKPNTQDYSTEQNRTKKEIRLRAEQLETAITKSGLQRSGRSSFQSIYDAVNQGNYADLLTCGITANPVNKPGKNAQDNLQYDQIISLWEELGVWINQYREHYARTYYYPYLKIYQEVQDTLERVKRQEGTVFIEDISKQLAEYIKQEIIPDVYFRLGDTIYHHLIDEFQDTSPIQWDNLIPLIENSLSTQGSLFIVGDTKQAIYGFRNADFEIMQNLVTKKKIPFASVEQQIHELPMNYRSQEAIVEFNQQVFHQHLPDKFHDAGTQSGLTEYQQSVKKENQNKGYVEISRLAKNPDLPEEKAHIQELVNDLKSRGYSYSDIAILAYKNDTVVEISSWLNEIGIPFISYSELDIRKQKVTGELITLLKFLDSPPDDLSFATFLLGDIFQTKIKQDNFSVTTETIHQFLLQANLNKCGLVDRPDCGIKSEIRNPKSEMGKPLYKAFQAEFPTLWETYFDGLFKSVGYLPLYDLTTEIYRTFDILSLHSETQEATFVKLLEVIKDFEGKGANTLGAFLTYSTEEETETSIWNIAIPKAINAVTIMSIHKAKGLEFPVVILLLHEQRNRPIPYIFQEQGDTVNLLKINQKLAEAAEYLQALYDRDRTKDMVNRLNTVYVAMTRPAAELYIIGVADKADVYPLNLLPIDEYPAKAEKPVPTLGKLKGEPMIFPRKYQSGKKRVSENIVEVLNYANRKRGDLLHQILARIEYFETESGLSQQIDTAINIIMQETGEKLDSKDIKQSLIPFLMDKDIKPYFIKIPNRIILQEQEIVDASGKLFRLDRMILDEQKITILDFKTGPEEENEPEYRAQVNHYLGLVAAVYPKKPIEGYIGYIDLKKIIKVKSKRLE